MVTAHELEKNKPLSVVIVEDEFHARNILAHYIEKIPDLQLVGQYDNCIACYDAHDLDTIDILLLDINLPDISGMQFARTVSRSKAHIIFTTAYSEYAVAGYELNVIDYLLKPIHFERFEKAIIKVRDLILLKKMQRIPEEQPGVNKPVLRNTAPRFLFVKSDYKIIKINFANVLYIEGLQEYVRIYQTNGPPIVTLLSLKRLSDMLPSPPFFRIHRSHIINIDQLDFVHQKNITIGGKELSVGKNYEEEFFNYLQEHGIF